jgi:hypothetical protein
MDRTKDPVIQRGVVYMKKNMISRLYKDGNLTGASQAIFIVLGTILLFG